MKSYKEIRYHDSKIFEILAEQVLVLMKNNEADQMLSFYTLGRLAMVNEPELFLDYLSKMRALSLFKDVSDRFNLVAIFFYLSIHQKYEDVDFIKELLKAFLCHPGDITEEESVHRQFKISLDLLKIDRPDLLESDEELASLCNACKE